jgi:hypothetical protein
VGILKKDSKENMQPEKGGRTHHDDEIYGLYSSPKITVIKLRRMRQAA